MEIVIISLFAQVFSTIMLLKHFSLTSKPSTITDQPEKLFGAQNIAEQQTTENGS